MRMSLERDPSFTWRAEQAVLLSLFWPPSRARVIQLIEITQPPVRRRRGHPMQLTMATVAEHADVHDDVTIVAAVNEPTSAGDKPYVERRKTHEPPEVLVRVKRDWSLAQCLRIAIRALPDIFTIVHVDTLRRWLATKTSGLPCRPRFLEPVAVLALADVASRVCGRVCCGPGVASVLRMYTWKHVASVIWVFILEPQGRAREGVARSSESDTSTTVPTEDRADIERCGHHGSQPHH